MKFSFGLDQHIKDKVKDFVEKNNFSQEEIDDLVLMINMSYSSGYSKGSSNARTLAKNIGSWSNNN